MTAVAPAQAPPWLTRNEYVSCDAGRIREFLAQAYGARLQLSEIDECARPVSLRQLRAGPIGAADLAMPLQLTCETSGQDQYVFATMIEGTTELTGSRGSESFGPGDVFVAIDPQIQCVYRVDHVRSHTITVPAFLMDDLRRTSLGEPVPRLDVACRRSTDADGHRWRAVVRLVEGLITDPAAGPLVLGPAVRLLAGAALTTFSNATSTQPTPQDRHDAHHHTLHRAIGFIEANPTLDMSVADIAHAAYVTTRAVQLAFRRHLNTTPMAYLRQVRLQHAHEQLRAATSGDGLTVSRVARDWGFANCSRFAQYYRAAYSVSPTCTLQG